MIKETKSDFDEFEAASATEFTGLFARAPRNEYEYNSYYDVMNFFPEDREPENIFPRHNYTR